MNKQKWTEKPITWGGYLKLCGVVYVISMIAGFVWYIASFEPAWWGQLQGESEAVVHDLAPGKKILKSGSRRNRRLFLFFHRGCFYEDAVPNLE